MDEWNTSLMDEKNAINKVRGRSSPYPVVLAKKDRKTYQKHALDRLILFLQKKCPLGGYHF